ncbi:Uncharacterised protein [Moraxella caprae]|uniref:Uncharacterized protein n=1 Tax=Moraxella caprae TaxID=90240 RepID=A0A378R272_9GAMM|nr:pyocin knob domain-containing protein [Moraxella caprae]STZ09335.1 Uncharacterised protein [Moraxella caprae]
MANLRETSTWEAGIYQLETSDPVMGGENGIDNRAPRQLANRTLWLKNELARQIGVVNSGKLGKTENAVSASKLATARNIAMTGDGSWSVNFNGSQNATGAMTLANSGVTAGSYNSVTVDAKGRVTAGLAQTHGLVTATTAQGTANVATGNSNTFLNIVASGVGRTASVGSSTQITGTNGITVSSDTAGKLIVRQVLANSLTDTSTAKALTALQGKVLDEKISALDNRTATLRGQLGTTDLNTLTAAAHTGIWYQENNNNATTERNYPAARSGILFVLPSVWQGQQLYFPYNENALYTRYINNSNSWSAWYKIGETINNLTSASTTASLSANQGKILNETKLDKAGGVLTGAISMPTSVTSMPANTAFAISYGRIQGYSNLYINANTDNSGNEAVVITSGKGLSANKNDGLAVGSNYLTWLGAAVATVNSNVATATKLATARTLAITGDGTGQANFDGSANANIALTLASSGVRAGSYNSVTVDAKGRVTAGLTQTHGLVTATSATGTANTATTNTNTFLNIVASGVGSTASVGSSTQITGTNGISVSSDTAGKLIVTRDSNSPTATKLQTARTLSITGDGTGQANFDGSNNANIALTLASSGVRAGSYNSVTVDAKGRVTAGLTQTHGLVTATSATGTANTATTNSNTFLNIVASGVGTANSVGSSTQITGTNGITVSSDTAGKLIVARDSNSPTATKLQTARKIALTGAVTGSVNFDGSRNVSLATALKGIDRREYTGTLTPSHNSFKSQKVPITGSVEVLPNGRMVQYFTFVCPVVYFHKHGLSAFYREKLGVQTFAAADSPHLELPLWTPMPNKVQEAHIYLGTAGNHYSYGEALEWIYDWDAILNHQSNIKDKAYFAFRRWDGTSDEIITFTIVVEGY